MKPVFLVISGESFISDFGRQENGKRGAHKPRPRGMNTKKETKKSLEQIRGKTGFAFRMRSYDDHGQGLNVYEDSAPSTRKGLCYAGFSLDLFLTCGLKVAFKARKS